MASNKPKKSANKKPQSDKTKVTVLSEKTEKPETVAQEEIDEVVEATEVEEVEEVEDSTDDVEEIEESNEEDSENSEAKKEEKVTEKTVTAEKTSETKTDDDKTVIVKETKETTTLVKETEEKTVIVSECAKNEGFFKRLFSLKHDENENILTIFHSKKIWGALIAEALGTMVISMFFLTLGVYQPLYVFFLMVGVTGIFYSVSGANLNPAITVGLMASRRMSAIRGVLYIFAQIFGAWLGYAICGAFLAASDGTSELPVMSEIESSLFMTVTLVEFLGCFLIALFYAQAIEAKKCKCADDKKVPFYKSSNPLVVAGLYAGGVTAAFIVVIIISSTWLGLSNNYIMNPAVALMYQVLPTSGDNFGDLLADIGLALVTYVIGPMIAGTLGFYVSDLIKTFDESK